MSTSDQLKQQLVAKKDTTPAKKTISGMITSDSFQNALRLICTKVITPERITRLGLSLLRSNPLARQCTPESFALALQKAAQLGLEPCTPLQQCYLIPRYNSKTRSEEINFQIGYKGWMELVRRSGQIQSLSSFVVYQGDEFHYQLGLHPDIQHIPNLDADKSDVNITHAYAVAQLKDGGVQFEVMSRRDIDKARAKAQTKNIWNEFYADMARKTVIIKLCKYLPQSREMAIAEGWENNPQQRYVSDDGEVLSYDLPEEEPIVEVVEAKAEEPAAPAPKETAPTPKAKAAEKVEAAEGQLV